MSATLAHPFRLDSAGRAVTIEQGTARHAAETAGHILACMSGERALAPLWGVVDPSGGRIDGGEVRAVVSYAEPALRVDRADVGGYAGGRLVVDVEVSWADTDEEEGAY